MGSSAIKVIARGRAGGKTHEALKMMVEDNRLYMVTPTTQQADQAWKMARGNGFDLKQDRFMSFRALSGDERPGAQRKYIVDNAGDLLEHFLHIEIAGMTVNGSVA